MKCITEDIVFRLKIRATIRRNIVTRKSVQDGKPDRISDLLEEAATEIQRLRDESLWMKLKTYLNNKFIK